MVEKLEEEAEEQPFGSEAEEEEETPKDRPVQCRFCTATFNSTAKRGRHEKRMHPHDWAAMRALGGPGPRGKQAGIPGGDSLSEKAKEFADSLAAAAPELNPAKRRQLILAFEQEADVLVKDATELENFLDDYGLTMHQIRQMRRRIIGRRGGTLGQQTVMAVDPRTGQQVPVIVINPGGQGGGPGAPFILTGQGGGVSKEDLREAVENAVEKAMGGKEQSSGPQAGVRRYQEPILDGEGNPATDRRGNIVMRWVEEPIEPGSALLNSLVSAGIIQKPLTAEDVAKIRGGGERPERERSPEFQDLKDEMTKLNFKLEKKEAVEETAKEVTRSFMERMEPQFKELEELRSGGLPPEQARFRHEENLLKGISEALGGFREGIRDDLRPLVLQQAVSSMRGMGLSEQTIVDLIGAQGKNGGAAPERGSRAEKTLRDWVKEQ